MCLDTRERMRNGSMCCSVQCSVCCCENSDCSSSAVKPVP